MIQEQVVLQLAQQGNPQAIARCVNYKLKPFGITAQARVQNDCLHILLESDKLLNKEKLTSFVVQVAFRLQLTSNTPIKALAVYGKRTGENKLLWQQQKLLARQEVVVTVQRPQPQLQKMAQQRIARMVADKANARKSERIDSLTTWKSIAGIPTKQFDESDTTVDALFAHF